MADHGYGEVAYQIGHEQEAVLQDSDHMQGFPLRVPIDLSGQLTYTLPDLFLGEDNAQVIPVGSHPGLGGGCFGSELGGSEFSYGPSLELFHFDPHPNLSELVLSTRIKT